MEKHTQAREIETVKYPITPSTALQLFSNGLTPFEQGEILNYTQIYYLGLGAPKIKGKQGNKNHGFDDERDDFKVIQGDHIAYRFEILGMLGSGSFGKVLRVMDHKEKREVALKIIRNKKNLI